MAKLIEGYRMSLSGMPSWQRRGDTRNPLDILIARGQDMRWVHPQGVCVGRGGVRETG